mgnify:CR=1 FL=1
MKHVQFHPPTLDRIRDLKASGADTAMLDTAVSRLRSRQKLSSRHFNGQLAAYRSAVVGTTADGRTVAMVYRVTARTVIVDMVDEHDAAYRVMREEVQAACKIVYLY